MSKKPQPKPGEQLIQEGASKPAPEPKEPKK
jgi:hypothetical protein